MATLKALMDKARRRQKPSEYHDYSRVDEREACHYRDIEAERVIQRVQGGVQA
jgi:hypothetical protein